MPEQRQRAIRGYDCPRAPGHSKANRSQKMRRSTYDSTLKRSDISNIDTIGTYNRTFSRSTRTSPGRWPNHPSHPRIVNSPTTMMPRPTMMISWPSVLLPTVIVTVGTRRPPAWRLPPRQVLACRVNHDSALSRGDLFPGRPQPPQQKRVKQRRHPDLELSLSEFENPAHDVKNQRIDRQPERGSERPALSQDYAYANDRQRETHDLLDPPETRLDSEGMAHRCAAKCVDPAVDGEYGDQRRDDASEIVPRKDRGPGLRRSRICHGMIVVWSQAHSIKFRARRDFSDCHQSLFHGLALGNHLGTADLYSTYAAPNRLSSAGSSEITK